MNTTLNMMSACQLINNIKNKEISAEEVICAYIERVQFVNPHINAVVQLDAEAAIAQAKKIDSALARGLPQGKLVGLPITVKNVCHVKGFAPDKGCIGLKGKLSTTDSSVVSRLKNEGAIVIGLTNTPELSIGFETDNLVYGRTNNPYCFERTPGGSSGGEAAIIAAGGSALGIGSDASGSIRVPAHNTGIVAIRATQGRVPITGNIPFDGAGLFSQFISFGLMARYVEDICLSLPIIIGPDNRDPHVVPVPLHDSKNVDLSTLRIAYYIEDGISHPTSDIAEAVQSAVLCLKEKVKLINQDVPTILQQIDSLLNESILLGGDEGEWLTDIYRQLQLNNMSPLLNEFFQLAKTCKFSITDLRKRWVRFDQYRSKMLEFMDNYDVIICPTAATPAKKHGFSFKEIRDFSHSMAFTLTGWPVVVVRCGESNDGLPIGLQIVAKPWREDVALAVANFLEKSLGGWKPPSENQFIKHMKLSEEII